MGNYKKGDLVKTSSGIFATIVRGSYRHRFMDATDYDMIDSGMGHMAGSYGSAIDIMIHETGSIRRVSSSDIAEIK